MAQLWCDFMGARNVYLAGSIRSDNHTSLRNAAYFGAATYIGSTVILNSDGLSGSQSEDLTEAGLGIGILQASRSLFDSRARRTVYDNAVFASECYIDHVEAVIAREANISWLNANITALRERREGLDLEIGAAATSSDLTGDDAVSNAVIAAARTASARALEIELKALAQIAEYASFEFEARRANADLRPAVLRALRSEPMNIEAILATIRSAAQIASQFEAGEVPGEGEAVPEVEKGDRESANSLQERIQLLTELTRGMNSATAMVSAHIPNITGLMASFRTCATSLQTGARTSVSSLNDHPVGDLRSLDAYRMGPVEDAPPVARAAGTAPVAPVSGEGAAGSRPTSG